MLCGSCAGKCCPGECPGEKVLSCSPRAGSAVCSGVKLWLWGARLPRLGFCAPVLTRRWGRTWGDLGQFSTSPCLSFLICKVGARLAWLSQACGEARVQGSTLKAPQNSAWQKPSAGGNYQLGQGRLGYRPLMQKPDLWGQSLRASPSPPVPFNIRSSPSLSDLL